VKRALLSVYDKKGIVEIARTLVENGYEIVSSGGTAKHLRENSIEVTEVSEITETKEMLAGRVKTLHPRIFGGILAREKDAKELDSLGIEFIDIVICNLYPFEEVVSREDVTREDAIENIDIGGVTLLRAAAKNFERVIVLYDPKDYTLLQQKLKTDGLSDYERLSLARKAFSYTCKYDSAIFTYFSQLSSEKEDLPEAICTPIIKTKKLRYGENPHQVAGIYKEIGSSSDPPFEQIQGKGLSYINIIDMESAYTIANSFSEIATAIIKHTNPCGVGVGDSTTESYARALSTDSMSAFGGIIGFNRTVTGETASEIIKSFKEVVIAPDFEKDALEIFKKKKNLRVIIATIPSSNDFEFRTYFGGWLVQTRDDHEILEENWKFVSKKKPSEEQLRALRFGWKVVGFVKSNAIVITDSVKTLGIGAGQMSRIDAAELSVKKSQQAGFDIKGAVLSSDAFFPFRDSIDFAAKNGISAVIEPGGSKRDPEVIEAANEHGIVLVFTGRRHFRH
jgi:phosphoribosylaminoimidazolecarboxamide formyltransferase/IMP cyclohydrolase